MNADSDNTNFDELISKAIGRDKPQFDFDKWKQSHKKEIEIYDSQTIGGKALRYVEPSNIWRIIMNSKITKLATVTVVILAVVVGVILIDRSATPAYAVDQTIAAIQTIRTLHMRVTGDENGIEKNDYVEGWIKYDDAGRMTNFRLNVYRGNVNEGGEDPIYGVWNNGIEKMWKPDENNVFIRRVNNAEAKLQGFLNRYDPKFMQQKLQDASQNKEQYDVTIDDSAHEDFIYVEVLDRDNKTRLELLVDPETKLITQLDEYDLDKQGGELNMRVEFLAYNQPIDPELFELNEMPDDVRVHDKVHELVGIKKEAMSNHEVAVEVVRQCLEATIVEDYDEASRLMAGHPGNTIKDFIEEKLSTRLVRVVSMGQPKPYKTSKQFLCVPCEIEVQNGEGTKWIVNIIAMARPIDYQSGNRWVMHHNLEMDVPGHIANEIMGSTVKGIIVPGVRVGDYLLGMSKDAVLASLGEPRVIFYGAEQYTLNNLPETYYMVYRDFRFVVDGGLVITIRIGKPFYQFANGLKVGDSKDDIIQAFGHDFKFIETESGYVLTYKDKGLSFGINKENNTIKRIKVYSPLLLKNLLAKISRELEGIWQDSCQQVVQDGDLKNQKAIFNFSGDTVKIERIDYQDKTCSIKSSSLVLTGTFALSGESNTIPGVMNLDYTVLSVAATFHHVAAVNIVNQMKFLGYSDWQVNVTKDITGAPGISSKGDKLYEIYKIEEGNKLYIGSNEAVGSPTRPTSLRRFYAIKQ